MRQTYFALWYSSLSVCVSSPVGFNIPLLTLVVITSLGDLLFCLSGSGITSRRKKFEVGAYARPVQEFSEFVTRAVNLILEPIKEDLGEADESVGAVLCMADTFVRLGRLHTVREIEEYIITTAHVSFHCHFL